MNFIPCESITIESYEYNFLNKKSLHISIKILNPQNFPLEENKLANVLKSIAAIEKNQLKNPEFFEDYYVSLTTIKKSLLGSESYMRGDKFDYRELNLKPH